MTSEVVMRANAGIRGGDLTRKLCVRAKWADVSRGPGVGQILFRNS